LIVRWIYNLWNLFWKTIGYLFVAVVFITALLLAGLQLPQSKEYIKEQIVDTFNSDFKGTVQIERLGGFIPFRADLYDVEFYAPDDEKVVLELRQGSISVNLWSLLQQEIDITQFELHSPKATIASRDDELTLQTIFTPKSRTAETRSTTPTDPDIFYQYNIYAPAVTIYDGELNLDESIKLPDWLGISTPSRVKDIQTGFIVESSDRQFFVDILNFEADVPRQAVGTMQFSGQLFNDGHFFELNGVRLRTNTADIDFTAEATSVDLFSPNVVDELLAAEYRVEFQQSTLQPEIFEMLVPDFPALESNIVLELLVEGTFESLFVDRFNLSLGESSIMASGELQNILENNFSYNFTLDNMVLYPGEIGWITETQLQLPQYDFEQYQTKIVRGTVRGDFQNTDADLSLETSAGNMQFNGEFAHADTLFYNVSADLDSLDISPFIPNDTLQTSVLNGSFFAEGYGLDDRANLQGSINLTESNYSRYYFKTGDLDFTYNNRNIDFSLFAEDEQLELETGGSISFIDELLTLNIDGGVQNLDVTNYLHDLPYSSSNFNGRFSTNLNGKTIDDLQGRISFEISESTINEDTLRPHQLYLDIDSPELDRRTLRFTSSFFDGELTGTIIPTKIGEIAEHWAGYFQRRVSEELLFIEPDEEQLFSVLAEDEEYTPIELDGNLTLKDLPLLRLYLPDLPTLESAARINFHATATKEQLAIRSDLSEEHFSYADHQTTDFDAAFTGSFNYNETLKSGSIFSAEVTSANSTIFGNTDIEDASLSFSMENDTISINQKASQIAGELAYQSSINAYLFDDRFVMEVDQLSLGSPNYEWLISGGQKIIYRDDNTLTFDDFAIGSESDLLKINGTFSDNEDDSVEYIVENFDLSRISDLIGGRVQFSGTIDGAFTSRTLANNPSLEGELTVDNGRINNRVIGDVSLTSTFNREENQFDTDIHVYTDPEKYSSYLEDNNGVGQDLQLTGFFKSPMAADEDEDLFYFDADLREVDLWIVTFIVPTIITEANGRASGTGFIRGNASDYDFSSTFDIDDVHAKPFFTNVDYTIDGELVFNREDGLLFNDMTLADRRGGTGTLSGQVDLDDFSPITILDLTLDLDDLHFMNNQPDPDVPFYSSLYGTGQATITGTNLDPFLRTTQTVILSSDSRISIPLREQTEFEQDRRFIQFVESFDLPDLTGLEVDENDINGNNNDDEQEDLTFVELFTMDLQFIANDPIDVQLIFDPVTNEEMNASGTGQVRLLLEDQDLSMFGRFNIQDGDYQFVGGDIITRRFSLREGGSISWQGDLVDANLNIDASYRARPNISSLLPTESFQRIPLDLVLEIGGTISSVENNFFFQVPGGIDGTVDPTISAQINRINQNEDEKLLQAFAILLTGNFVPSAQSQTAGLGEGITGTGAIVNPLLSSQIISPLLSNQINALLTDDVVFDVDVNITQNRIGGQDSDYEFGVDLDVALRLFDDRFILRREGQVAGQQSNIGDLGATYRINRIFSVTAFHRQDITLAERDISTSQTQEMNGMGLEAEFQFNTWQNLRQRISYSFRRLFGMDAEEPEDEESLVDN